MKRYVPQPIDTSKVLVSYEQLSEFKKDYDRRTSMEALKVLISRGYKLVRDYIHSARNFCQMILMELRLRGEAVYKINMHEGVDVDSRAFKDKTSYLCICSTGKGTFKSSFT